MNSTNSERVNIPFNLERGLNNSSIAKTFWKKRLKQIHHSIVDAKDLDASYSILTTKNQTSENFQQSLQQHRETQYRAKSQNTLYWSQQIPSLLPILSPSTNQQTCQVQ